MPISSHISTSLAQRINAWLEGPYDAATKHEIERLLREDPRELENAFFTDLSFGTGGLRSLMGVGPNRLNLYTIQFATQGLAHYLLKQKKSTLSVLIGFDSRHHSKEFAEEAARVLAGNGIRVYLLSDLRPVGYVSFGCRHYRCDSAIMITASHNPKAYNGYKVYGSDGAQVVSPADLAITAEMSQIRSPSQVQRAELSSPLITRVDASLDVAFLEAIRPLQCQPQQNQQHGSSLKITYTSLHGTGITMVPQALNSWGFSSLIYVEEQIEPNGDFPTTPFPNPEYPEALNLGTARLLATHSDILLATDPDADRMGVVVLHKGKPIPLTGNEMAAICVEYLCATLTELKALPKRPAIVTTIVTSALLPAISRAYHIPCFEVLTGFKYIGEKIHEWETAPHGYDFIFGAEESYGCLLGTYARDKDAIIGCCLIAEIALHAKQAGKTLIDRLYAIYERYGIYRDKQHSFEFLPGKEGMETMTRWMENLRNNPPQAIADKEVMMISDYKKSIQTICKTGATSQLTLPQSNVLAFELDGGSKLVIRPSGTEPKIKIYASVVQKEFPTAQEGLAQCDEKLEGLLKALEQAMKK